MKKTTKRIVIGVAAFVAVICGLSSLVVTKENEYTLIMRFGKINNIKTEAGLSFKVPFLDSEQTLPKEILLYDMAASDVIIAMYSPWYWLIAESFPSHQSK